YVSAALIIHNSAGLVCTKPQRYEVAPVGNVLGFKSYPDTCRFKRRSSSIVAQGIITEDAQVCNIGSGVKALGNSAHAPDNPFTGQSVHIGRFSPFERSQPVQFLNRPVRHAVSDNNHVFHKTFSMTLLTASNSALTLTASSATLNTVSGSFNPFPVNVQTTVSPFLKKPALYNLITPASDAAEAGSQKTPSRDAMSL